MPRPVDLTLYLVTDTVLCGTRGVAATVDAAVRGGVTVVQVRDPRAPDDELIRLGRAVAAALAGTGVPLIVNDRVHLVEAIGADGAHVGQGDLDPVAARSLLGPAAILGLSVQTLAHVDAAAALPPGTVDHLGVGPVWWQATKPDAADPGGLDTLAAIVRRSPMPCVAIGGIDAGRAALVRSTGAAGVAVVSAICGTPDPVAAARRVRAAWDGADAPTAPVGAETRPA
ncbi:thiamine phosphate synthase [Nakamurella sp.]|uniref:thiamine phosphate synthase n=1 Tax=Nakamurella sp. TaxID=1869182 RepID=UPI00378430EB